MTRLQDGILTAGLCLFIGLLIFWDTSSYPVVQGQGFGQGPAFYPRFLGSILLAFGILSFLLALFAAKKSTAKNVSSEDTREKRHILLPAGIVILTLLFIVCLPWLGFLVDGYLLVTLSSIFIRGNYGIPAIFTSAAVGLIIIFLIWLIFSFFIGVDLPSSQLFLV